MLGRILAGLLAFVVVSAPAYGQLRISASGGGLGALTLQVNEFLTFIASESYDDISGLILVIEDAYQVDQAAVFSGASFNSTTLVSVLDLAAPPFALELNQAFDAAIEPVGLGPRDMFISLTNASNDMFDITADDTINITAGTFTIGLGGFALPDNLSNANLYLINDTGDVYSNTFANQIPEPASAWLLLGGLGALVYRTRTRQP